MTGFVKVLLIIAVIYFAMQLIVRYLLPFLLTRFISRKMEEMSGRVHNSGTQNRRKEGEITVDYKSAKKKKHIPKNSGDYIDFEEIKK